MGALRNWLIGLGVVVAMAISVALVVRSLPDDETAPLEQAAKTPPPAQAPAVAAKPEPEPAPAAAPANEGDTPKEAAKSEPQPERPPAAPAAPPLSTMQGRATELLAIPPAGVIGGAPSPPSAAVSANGHLQFSPAQEDRVRYVLMSHNVMQSEAPDFPLQLGGAVPENVRLAPLPIEISDIVPNYRDYAYVISQNRIVIVTIDRRTISSLISIEARG